MSYLVLARKWRPKGFEDLIGQEGITRILSNAISQGKIAHAYLFSGPRGVGKTSTARILAKALNCEKGPDRNPCGDCLSCSAIAEGTSMDVMEIDGASNNSVNDIRDLRERVKYVAAGGGYKVYIIDEAHMLSDAAFNALLKTLEEPPSRVVFVLATTVPRKIPATVLSRCQHLPFKRIPGQKIKARLKMISDLEGINIDDEAIEMIARAADGGMRDSLTILDQVAAFSSDISASDIKDLLGVADFAAISELSRAVLEGDRDMIVSGISGLTEKGTDLRAFSRDLMGFFRDLLIVKIASRPDEILEVTGNELTIMKGIVAAVSEDYLTIMLSELVRAETDVRLAFSPRVALEMSLIKASFLNTLRPLNEAIDNIEMFIAGEGVSDRPQGSTVSKTDERARPKEPAGVAERQQRESQSSLVANAEDISSAKAPDSSGDACSGLTDLSEPEKTNGTEHAQLAPADFSWDAVVRKIDEVNHPLAGKLSLAKANLDGETLHIFFNGGTSVHIDSVKKSIKAVEKAASEVIGKKVSVKIDALKKEVHKKKDLKERAMSEPIVKGVIDLFDGRIVDIKPIENSSNGGNDV